MRVGMQSFVDVPVTKDGVDTDEFLNAVEALLKMFGAPRPRACSDFALSHD